MAACGESETGVITRQILKSKSGEFDIESIHTISLHHTGIHDLGCIGECSALERLNISYNDITRLHKLAGLTALTTLNLSANRISHLDGLQSLENLQSLNVSGNLIGSVDSLRCLAGLEKFTSLRVCDESAKLTNPMCNTSYIDEVLIMLPVLLTLDGKRVRGKGSELFQLCQYMDSALKNLPSGKHDGDLENSTKTTFKVPPDLSVMLESLPTVPATEAEDDLRALLANCRIVCQKADDALRSDITDQDVNTAPES